MGVLGGDFDTSFSNSGTKGSGIKINFGNQCETIPKYLFSIDLNFNEYFITPNITQVTFGNKLKKIGEHAFANCKNLKNFTLPNGLITIEGNAFANCVSLTEVTIPKTVQDIDWSSFYECVNLEKVCSPFHIPLDNCINIREIEITNENESEVYLNYNKLKTLERLTLDADIFYGYTTGREYGYEKLKYLKIGNMPEAMPAQLLNCSTRIEELSLPFVGETRTSSGNYKSVFGHIFDTIGRSGQEYMRIDQSYSSSEYYTYFIPTSLKKVYITDAIQLPYGAFSGCSGLEYIELNEGITQIGQKAFADCGFLSVKIPKSVSRIGTDAFSGTDVEKLFVYENSYAHTYAKENNFKYELVGDSKTTTNKSEKNDQIEIDSEEDEHAIRLKSITLNYDDVELTKGETITLKQTISPSNATNKKVIWSSSKSNVATVKNGKVTAIGTGTAIITATTEDGNKTASCVIIVNDSTKESDKDNQIILKIGSKSAKVFGKVKANDVAPKIVNDRTMLPARFVTENLGATVTWTESAPDMVLITKDNVNIIIYIGSDIAYVNGKKLLLDSPAFIENDRTYTPIRFISEALGASVEWNGDTQEVIITK